MALPTVERVKYRFTARKYPSKIKHDPTATGFRNIFSFYERKSIKDYVVGLFLA